MAQIIAVIIDLAPSILMVPLLFVFSSSLISISYDINSRSKVTIRIEKGKLIEK
ncbi:hypothetical protein [Paucisalibacillus globulus]|uniref:hypothetical protein n=1 Tax=Paucisalibacillus globulus TaxID=351095 RepID=UPI0012EB9114|nr:hypothetical protein [Paucisalibacillus globulus]